MQDLIEWTSADPSMFEPGMKSHGDEVHFLLVVWSMWRCQRDSPLKLNEATERVVIDDLLRHAFNGAPNKMTVSCVMTPYACPIET